MIGALVVMNYWFPDTFNSIFGDKISGENLSGQMRMEANEATRQLFQVFSLTNWLFGLGFGYTYNQVSDAVLANTGIIGFIIFCFVFLKPVWCLPRQGHLWGIQDLYVWLVLPVQPDSVRTVPAYHLDVPRLGLQQTG